MGTIDEINLIFKPHMNFYFYLYRNVQKKLITVIPTFFKNLQVPNLYYYA